MDDGRQSEEDGPENAKGNVRNVTMLFVKFTISESRSP